MGGRPEIFWKEKIRQALQDLEGFELIWVSRSQGTNVFGFHGYKNAWILHPNLAVYPFFGCLTFCCFFCLLKKGMLILSFFFVRHLLEGFCGLLRLNWMDMYRCFVVEGFLKVFWERCGRNQFWTSKQWTKNLISVHIWLINIPMNCGSFINCLYLATYLGSMTRCIFFSHEAEQNLSPTKVISYLHMNEGRFRCLPFINGSPKKKSRGVFFLDWTKEGDFFKGKDRRNWKGEIVWKGRKYRYNVQ